MPPTCEVKIDGAWRRMALAEVYRQRRGDPKRCLACHGQVRIFCHYLRGHRCTMRHDHPHDGCPLRANTYSGRPSPHPRALG